MGEAAVEQSSSNMYKEVFNGCDAGIVIEVAVPTDPYAKLMQAATGDYIWFGKPIGVVEGKQLFFSTFIHGTDHDLKSLQGKKVVGHPVIIAKKFPNGKTFFHLNIHLTSRNTQPSHRVLTRVAVAPPSIDWWQSKARKAAPAESDIVLLLPAPATGFVAIVSL